jgi:hypothetical protein
MPLTGYYNRFNPSDRYDELLFRAAKGLQSAELNEIQATQFDRLKRIADVLFKDGAVIRNGQAIIDPVTGVTQMEAGAIYVVGAVREVAAATFTIPVVGELQIGIRITTTEITELEDPDLRDPAVGTRNYQEPGAGRLRRLATWGWSGDGGTGDFYPVYTVRDGSLLTQTQPPVLDPVLQLIARYDRESNGNYAVRGMDVQPAGLVSGSQVFTVNDGVANILGFKVDKLTSTRLSYAEDPDLETIANEPKSSATASAQTITLNYKPLSSIQDVVITAQKTVTVNRGGFSGGTDPFPDTAILSIQSVTQGATTYTATTDYLLVGDTISWSPAGAEPAPGSTYSVTYRYLTSVTPTSINLAAGTFSVTGAVAGTLILVDYIWKLPRTDILAVNSIGEFIRIKGESSRFGSPKPFVPSSLLALATITNAWGQVAKVDNDAIRVTDMGELRKVRNSIVELFGLIALERLKTDISSREPTSKSGVFVDPFFDDDLRDQGITQDAVIIDGELQLPIASTNVAASQNHKATWLLPYQDDFLIVQRLRTGSMKINPYQAFAPPPALVTLNPSVDQWTVVENMVTEQTRRFIDPTLVARSGDRTITFTRELVETTRTDLEFLRQIAVEFIVEGFGAGEQLVLLEFDGIDITPL